MFDPHFYMRGLQKVGSSILSISNSFCTFWLFKVETRLVRSHRIVSQSPPFLPAVQNYESLCVGDSVVIKPFSPTIKHDYI